MPSTSPNSSKVSLMRSLLFQCTLLIGLCILAVVAVFQIQSNLQIRSKAQSVIEQRAAEVTELLSSQMGGAIKFGNTDVMEKIVTEAIETAGEDVVRIVVVDADQNVVLSMDAPNAADSGPIGGSVGLASQSIQNRAMVLSDDGLSAAEASRFGGEGEIVGAVVTHWTLAPTMAVIAKDNLSNLINGILVFVVALLAAGFMLRARMSQPLVRLERAMQRVAVEDYDSEIPYAKRGDEIGMMAGRLDEFRRTLATAKESQLEAVFKSAAFEGSSAGMMMVNTKGEVMFANPRCSALLGELGSELAAFWPEVDGTTFTGKNITSFAAFQPTFKKVLADGAGADGGAASDVLITKIGDRIMRVTASAVLDAAGQLFGCVIEWSDRTRAENNAAMINAININQATIEFSKEGRVVAANGNFLKMINGTFADTALCSLSRMFVGNLDGDPDGKKFARAAFAGEIPPGEYSAYSVHANKTFIVDGTFTVLKNTDGTADRVMFLGNNVTEQAEKLQAIEKERATVEAEQNQVVEILRVALKNLAEGDLESDIKQSFPSSYEGVRSDFNETVSSLRTAISAVTQNSESIRNETSEITSAADDLSRRTEKQAATLEETAAALDELTVSVRSAAEGADDASTMSAEAQHNAEQGGEVAKQAVKAMDGIKTSSQEISKITSVIDDIAFQTNLLALNAGVEAARAGEAGRGFAVVATEVRALAQRSSDAAREINALISSSGEQVQQGVELVDRTGTSLAAIVKSIADISERVANIAASAREQSSGLAEINTAVNELDHVTQQNAAMFEETTAASHALRSEADALVQAVSRFKMADTAPPVRKSPPKSMTSQTAPVSRAPMTQGNAAVDIGGAVHADADGWEEF